MKVAAFVLVALLEVAKLGCSHAYATTPEMPMSVSEMLDTVHRPVDIRWRDSWGRSQLYYLVRYGSQRKAIEYLKRLRGVGPLLDGSQRILNVAISSGAGEVVQWLIENGEPVTASKSGDDRAPILVAAISGRLEIVEQLLDHGALGAAHRRREEATRVAVEALIAHREAVFFLLLKNGLDLGMVSKAEAGRLLFAAAVGGSAEATEAIMRAGVDPDVLDEFGRTALIAAIQEGNADVVGALVKGGADVCTKMRGNPPRK